LGEIGGGDEIREMPNDLIVRMGNTLSKAFRAGRKTAHPSAKIWRRHPPLCTGSRSITSLYP
jgi:hypothetical protein